MTQQIEKPEEEVNLVAALECLLFLAEEPLAEADLARMLEATPGEVNETAEALAAQYAGRGLQVMRVAGGWRLCTRPEYAPYISRLHEPEKVRLSRPALETLAIIAYRQPITRPEMEGIRGVNVDGVVTTLLNRGLIEEKGRKEAPGRPMLYGTTTQFLTHFGIDKVEDLPELPQQVEEGAEAAALAEQEQAAEAEAEREAPEAISETEETGDPEQDAPRDEEPQQ